MDDEISTEEVRELLDAGEDVRIVDIRPAAAFERGHIPDSENIPFGDLPDQIKRLDGAERVVTVCPHGQASVQAARLVASYEGVPDDARVESMAGGLEAWEYDLERGPDETDGESATDGETADASPADESADEASANDGSADEEVAEGPDAPF